MRINKYLALKGYSTRRGADALIEKGLVTINGKKAQVGDQIAESDSVEVRGKKPAERYYYYAYHKPIDVVTGPLAGKRDIMAVVKGLPPSSLIVPIGRLDEKTSGLILLSNDPRIVHPLQDANAGHEKEYEVTVQEVIARDFEQKIEKGVDICGYRTKPCKVVVHGRNTFSIILTEGKNRQIRKMCAALGYTITKLIRRRIMHIHLKSLGPNEYRALTDREVTQLLQDLKVA